MSHVLQHDEETTDVVEIHRRTQTCHRKKHGCGGKKTFSHVACVTVIAARSSTTVASGCHPGDTVVAARRVGGFPYVVPWSDAETNALRNSVATKKAIQRLRTSIAARVDSMKDDIELNVLKQVTSAPTFCGSRATTRWCVITAHWSSRRCQPWTHVGRCCITARATCRSASAVCTGAYMCRHWT